MDNSQLYDGFTDAQIDAALEAAGIYRAGPYWLQMARALGIKGKKGCWQWWHGHYPALLVRMIERAKVGKPVRWQWWHEHYPALLVRVIERAQVGDPAWAAHLTLRDCAVTPEERAALMRVICEAKVGDPAGAAYWTLRHCEVTSQERAMLEAVLRQPRGEDMRKRGVRP